MTDRITIPIDVVEAAAAALGNFVSDHGWSDSDMQAMDNLDSYIARHKAIRAELAKPVEPVTPVAWLDDFGSVFPIGARKGAESWIESWIAANQRNWKPLYLRPPTPTWHDAPEVAALKAERDELLAALKAMYSEAIRIRCSIHQKWLQIMNTASAAIAKAEGRTE